MLLIVYQADAGNDTLAVLLLGALIVITYKYVKLNNMYKKHKGELLSRVLTQNQQITKLELDTTRFQLNPHAFKNTLSMVKYFAERTTDAIDKLSDVLGYMVYESRDSFVTLRMEVHFMQRFIDLYKLRLDYPEIVHLDIANLEHHPFWDSPVLPPMMTAYFIENAFKHGRLDKTGDITIQLLMAGNRLIYTVSNPVNTIRHTGHGGVGYENMKKRLETLYPHRHTLRTQVVDGRFVAHLEIELRLQHEPVQSSIA